MNDMMAWLYANEEILAHLCESDTEINGVKVSVSQETLRGDPYVYQTLTLIDHCLTFERKGRKVYSYEVWVESVWYEWVEV